MNERCANKPSGSTSGGPCRGLRRSGRPNSCGRLSRRSRSSASVCKGGRRCRRPPGSRPLRHNETHCTGADANRRERTGMLPFRTLTKTHEQERTCIRSRRSGPRYRGSNPCLPANLRQRSLRSRLRLAGRHGVLWSCRGSPFGSPVARPNPCLPANLKLFQHNQLAPMLDLGAIAP